MVKMQMETAPGGTSATLDAILGARDIKWYKGHYLKLNAILVSCLFLNRAHPTFRQWSTPNFSCWPEASISRSTGPRQVK